MVILERPADVALDRGIVGTRLAPHSVEVERGRLRFFAEATGQTDPVYTDVRAARSAGHRDLPVPPTFLFCLAMEGPDSARFLADLGVDVRSCLHGSQSFAYHAQAYAGDRLGFATSITDVYEKKGGALQFVDRTTTVTRGGELIAELVCVVIVRTLEVGK